MRQIGILENQDQAERLTAFLITQGIPAHLDQEDASWAIWVRDEDHLDEAKDVLEQFARNPDDSRYQGARREASAILNGESKRREEARKNVIQMHGRWNRSASRRSPLVVAVILLCVVVFLLSGLNANPASSVAMRTLSFCDTMQPTDWNEDRLADRLVDIRAGQVWRIVTPIFLHGGIFHLAFNMYMFHLFGRVIENRRGALRLALIMLVVALISNLAQGLAPSDWGTFRGGPGFLGLSGVVYGLLGYLWMKTTYEPDSGLYVSGGTVAFLMIWMLLGFAGILDLLFRGSIANLAHGVGFLTGLAIGYWPELLRRLRA